MFPPAPQLAACLRVLQLAVLDARILGWSGERSGLGAADCHRLGELMDAVHNIPWLVGNWEQCDEERLRAMLGAYDQRFGRQLLAAYDDAMAAAGTPP